MVLSRCVSVFKSVGRKIKIFILTDFETKKMIIYCIFVTAISRYSILNVEFKNLKDKLGETGKETPYSEEVSNYNIARKVSWVVTTISKYTPWESKCLVQAMTAQKLLRRYNIKSTLYLGVRKSGNELKAHAWLRCGEYFVTGGDGSRYKEVAKFS